MMQAEALRQQLSAPLQTAKPWSTVARMTGVAVNPRIKEMVDLAYLMTKEGLKMQDLPHQKDDVVKGLFADLSQNIGRRPWGSFRTLTTASQVYHFKLDRLILPEECLRVLGFGRLAKIGLQDAGLTPAETGEFVGQAMSVPSVGVACMSLITAAIETGALSDVCSYVPLPEHTAENVDEIQQ